jgi:hypothetical protein
MLVEVTLDDLKVLWQQEYFREAESLGWVIVRENAATLLVDVRDRVQFLRNTPQTLSTEAEKIFVDLVQRN